MAQEDKDLNISVTDILEEYGMTLTEVEFEETPDYISNADAEPEGKCYLLDLSKFEDLESTRGNGTIAEDGTVKDVFVADSNNRVYYIKEGTKNIPALTLNSNGDSIFTSEYLGVFRVETATFIPPKAKLAYKSEWKTIIISNGRYDALQTTSLIYVQYYEGEELKKSFTLRGPSSFFSDEGDAYRDQGRTITVY